MNKSTSNVLDFSKPRLLLGALAILSISLMGCQTPGEIAYEEGKELRKRQQLRQAIAKFEEAVDLFKKEGGPVDKPYQKLASIYKELGGPYEVMQAVEYYRMAIIEDPDDIDYHVDLMSSLSKLGLCDESIEAYEEIKDHEKLKYDIKAKTELEAMYKIVSEQCVEEGIYGDQPEQLDLLRRALAGEPKPADPVVTDESVSEEESPAASATSTPESDEESAAVEPQESNETDADEAATEEESP